MSVRDENWVDDTPLPRVICDPALRDEYDLVDPKIQAMGSMLARLGLLEDDIAETIVLISAEPRPVSLLDSRYVVDGKYIPELGQVTLYMGGVRDTIVHAAQEKYAGQPPQVVSSAVSYDLDVHGTIVLGHELRHHSAYVNDETFQDKPLPPLLLVASKLGKLGMSRKISIAEHFADGEEQACEAFGQAIAAEIRLIEFKPKLPAS